MPAHLPENIVVDLSGLTVKSALGLNNLTKMPYGVKAVVRGSNKNPALVNIKLPEVAPAEGAAPAPRRPCQKRQKIIFAPRRKTQPWPTSVGHCLLHPLRRFTALTIIAAHD